MNSRIQNVESIFDALGVVLPSNIKQDIDTSLFKNEYINKHFAFLIDMKTNRILAYDFNVYLKSESFPFSVHAEIQMITKYYKSRAISKNKKILVVVKLSRTGVVGNSKCCLNCMRFIRNNFDNLNLKKVFYSDIDNRLVKLSRGDLVDENFRMSKGFVRSHKDHNNTRKLLVG